MSSKRILICDDHNLFTNGLSQLLNQANKNYEIESVNDSISCEKILENQKFDVFLCDLNIDNQDGFSLISKMKKQLLSTRTIIISAYCEKYLIVKAQKAGVHGYLKKDSNLTYLIEAIESNEPFYTNITSFNQPKNDFTELDEKFQLKFKLSKQEKIIIKLVISGNASKEIAEMLSISKYTVDTHRRNINRKLGVTNISSITKFVHENNLLD
jgi:two-component system nitrate/nitrite response regulator NarL